MERSSKGLVGLSLSVRQYAGEMPLTNALGLNVGALYNARTSPVLGFSAMTAPRCPGGNIRAMYSCKSRSIVVWIAVSVTGQRFVAVVDSPYIDHRSLDYIHSRT